MHIPILYVPWTWATKNINNANNTHNLQKPKQCRILGAVKPAQLLEKVFSEKILTGKCNLKHTKLTKEDSHNQI